MTWIYLFVAGLFEVVWAFSMKNSEGFTKLGPSAITIAAMVVSFWFLTLAMRSLPLGTAYTIWTGIGAVGAFTFGILFLGDIVTPMRLIAAGLILAGIVLMGIAGGH